MTRNLRSGYALLLIYVMAATMAIMLYMQLPKAAFEAQRDREQLLIDRGQEYKRAVQLYVRKFNRFPADINALENTQNIRFLRKQYVDPMTGKNEWRLIHVGPGGVFLDSLVNTNQQKKDANGPQSFITEAQQIGGNTGNPNQGVNQATRRRPEEGGNPSDPNNPGGNPLPASGPVMVLPDGRIVPATTTGIPAPTNPAPGSSGQQGQPGQPVPTGQIPAGFQNTPNAPGGANPNAANLINQILTTPRPGGLNGTGGFQPTDPSQAGSAGAFGGAINGLPANNTGTALPQTMGGSTVGGGIAGVASKMEQEGIKTYNTRTAYNEWEFVYDMSKDTTRTGGMTPPQPQPANTGTPFGTQPNQPAQPTAPPPQNPPAAPPTGIPGPGN
jgi:hypothetical protein